jgi:thymidylate kinase
MPFIAFLGCDGSGKSAVITGVGERLRARGLSVVHGHWMPKALHRQPAVNRSSSVEDPHGLPPRGALVSALKLMWLAANWWLAWWRGLRRSSRGGVVLFDRYHADLLVDPRRYRYGGPMSLARLASFLMPRPDLVIYLDAPAEVLLARKQEVPLEALERGRAAYLALAARDGGIRVIDASRPLEVVLDEVTALI